VTDEPPFGDTTTAPFWEGAERRELLIQHCEACGAHQFYPRPFCLACDAPDPSWTTAAGRGTVYARTTVHIPVDPALEPPYVVGLIELEEGPRLVAALHGDPAIGEPVRLGWREREGAPPLPVFSREEAAD